MWDGGHFPLLILLRLASHLDRHPSWVDCWTRSSNLVRMSEGGRFDVGPGSLRGACIYTIPQLYWTCVLGIVNGLFLEGTVPAMANTRERLQRCLSLLRYLQQRPGTREQLMEHVRRELGPGVYDRTKSPKALESQFSKDIQFLRETLEVDIPSVDRGTGFYELAGFGAFRPLALDEEKLEALALLSNVFPEEAPRGTAVRRLLEHVQELLAEKQRKLLRTRESHLWIPLEIKEAEQISPRVYGSLREAVRSGRALRFAYRSPAQLDGQPRIHTVWPERLILDPARGHLYLSAYWIASEGPLGRFEQRRWQRFRLDRILDDDHLCVLPEKLPPTLPRKPRYRLEYRLAPTIAARGQVTRHFEEMEVHGPDTQGWVQVTGWTDDLFSAVRLLLEYGPNCQVTGGPEARAEMEKLVRAMAKVYEVVPRRGVEREE